MTAPRHTYSLDELKDMLLASVETVVMHYAQPAGVHYVDKGKYFTLNPGRPDRKVGSFVVQLTGSRAGYWQDFATGDHGDILDLIALARGCSLTDAVKEARAWLGLSTLSPEDIARRRDQAEAARARRRAAETSEADRRAKKSKAAHALWLSGIPIANTPVEFYLRDARGIDLRALGHQPGALRYLATCKYTHTDPETGEVIDARLPAMLSLIQRNDGRPTAVHRTYLGQTAAGLWAKADVPEAKKVFGDYAGASISIWKGRDKDGRFGPPLSKLRQPTRLFMAEGVEDALSAAFLLPEARHIAAISLSNLAGVQLPPLITDLTIVADLDENATACAALDKAVRTHQLAGRCVRLWQNRFGGKDLNDALKQMKEGAA